eukprot:GDKJ01049650.1.p1 GENE.GDKJ01049650.1~~GDKJ01049650.1.p1  ORF type:complete len:182 (+),score=39.25 GDKJ01049650.1:1-546(+)
MGKIGRMLLVDCVGSSSFFGFMGVTACMVFSNIGSAYGTAKAGVGICSMGVTRSELVMKSTLPVIMAGVLGIYGLIISIMITGQIQTGGAEYSEFMGYGHLSAGLIVGLSCLAVGFAIGIIGDAGMRAHGIEEKMFVGVVLILVFAEALALYGLVVGIMVLMNTKSAVDNAVFCKSYAVAK